MASADKLTMWTQDDGSPHATLSVRCSSASRLLASSRCCRFHEYSARWAVGWRASWAEKQVGRQEGHTGCDVGVYMTRRPAPAFRLSYGVVVVVESNAMMKEILAKDVCSANPCRLQLRQQQEACPGPHLPLYQDK